MYKERTKEKIYNICIAEGSFIPLASIDTEQIKSIVHIALMDLFAVQQWLKIAKKDVFFDFFVKNHQDQGLIWTSLKKYEQKEMEASTMEKLLAIKIGKK